MHHAIARAALLFAAIHLARGSLAWACSCLYDEKTAVERLPDWDMVFVGEVIDAEQTTSGCGGGKESAEVVTVLEVIEGFQGVERGDQVEVRHSRDGASCGGSFEEGDRYLMFTDGAWSLCHPGGLAESHAADISELRDATD
jgi:hypothetical protein